MANQPTSMSNVRQIIKLFVTQRMGKKKIGQRLGMSKNTVKLYVEQFQRLQSSWDELSKLTDFELNKLFHLRLAQGTVFISKFISSEFFKFVPNGKRASGDTLYDVHLE